ncbi:glycosyltransferase family 25 protein [Polynucleobacter paneuropaeus]|nr:glycosyltransferase family 25 protein [Polynucleobacter paneuropaeus]MBT8520068.1 glycosyltransferase family 25 protein [Polynucleobacter paneuropaeus]MBT8529253.1 glycosyltransferase family 25 protein [Polynucleobacter paneuropaeus]MBT8532457.1 glycosyltransferase family 25 protein [Polynucleobacter paneuropaeus]MBT8574459.1 glycosyltransferase family 25 protein [Polynucleobacter paneuropaeus]
MTQEIQILVISLQRSPDRREKVRQELSKINLPWEFLDAVDGSQMSISPAEYKVDKVKRLQGYALTANEIGCYLSHKKAWQRCVDQNLPTLILEDDFTLAADFENDLKTLLENSDRWDLLRLQGLYEVPYTKVGQVGNMIIAKNQGDAVGATGYLVKPVIAQRLIDASHEIYEPVDHFLEHHQKHHLDFLAIRPYLIDITRVKSTIDDRSEREPIKGLAKRIRSVYRAIDRIFSDDPWFPK